MTVPRFYDKAIVIAKRALIMHLAEETGRTAHCSAAVTNCTARPLSFNENPPIIYLARIHHKAAKLYLRIYK